MTKTIWVDTTGASTTYVPREKPIQESVAPFSGTISGAAPATTNLGTNSGQRILAADGTWIPQPAFTSGGADQLETLRPSVISTSYSANPPTVTDSAKAYDVDTNHATTFGQWYAAQEARTNNRVDIFSLTTWASKTQTWTAATINVSRSYAILQDGESSATSGSSSKTSSVKYEFSTNNGSNWTTLGTDTQSSIPTAPQTLSMALGTLTPTMGNILIKVTITRGGGGTIYEDGVSLPGLTGEVDLKLFDVWIDGTYAGGAGNITCNNLTVTGDATFQNKIYDSTASAGTTGQVLKVAANGKVTWATDSAGSGTVTSITTTGANGVTISGGSTQTITTSGTFALALGNITPTSISTGTGSFSGDVEFAASIKSPNGSNSPVTIVPDGTGDLHVNADSLRLGDNNANATIATNGTGDLILTTHEGSATEGVIRLYDGANGNITLTPNGTGQVQVGSDQVVTLTASQTMTNKTLSTSSTWNGNTIGVAYGGTGSTTLTSGSYVVGNGTSAVTLKTPTQVTADLDTFTYQIGATAGKKGLVPAAPAIGASVVYLDQTGSWTTPSGSGTTTNALTINSPLTGTSFNGSTAVSIGIPAATSSVSGYLTSTDWNTFNNKGSGSVTSVAASVPSFLSVSGSPITTSGTLAISYSGTALPVANGGTGLTTLTAGYIPYGNGTSAFGSSANLFWDSSNSYLGIGTTSPSEKITVAGKIKIYEGGSGGYGWIYGVDTNHSIIMRGNRDSTAGDYTNYYQYGSSSGGHHFWTGGVLASQTEKLRITNDYSSFLVNNVGIGVTPSYKLDVSGTIHNNSSCFLSHGVQGNSSGLTFSGVGSNYGRLYEAANDRWALGYSATFGGSSTEVLNWNSSGNVGIGTSNLTVLGGSFKNLVLAGTTTNAGGYYIAENSDGSVRGQIGVDTSVIYMGSRTNHPVAFTTNNTERMRITSGGNLLIGATSQAYATSGYMLGVQSGGAQTFISIAKSGQTLDSGGMIIGLDAGGGYVWNRENINLYFGTNNTERMRITSGGDLLIGTTTSPSSTGISVGSTGTVRQVLGGMQNTSWRIRERSAVDSCAWTTNINDSQTQDDATKSSWVTQQGYGNGDNWRVARYPAGSSTIAEFMRIDSSGNVGIGVTPSAWGSAWKASQVQGYSVSTLGNAESDISLNAYNDNNGWRYIGSDYATQYRQGSGIHIWYTAPSGTAGNSITFTERMRIDTTQVKATVPFIGNSGTKGFGAVTTTTSTSTPTGGSSGDHYYIY